MAKTLSTFFFSLSFVCIGMDTRLKEIVSRENRNLLFSFIGAQLFNIVITMLLAWVMFGIVKPALWPTHKEEPKFIVVEQPTIIFEQPVEAEEISFDD